jgi:hypothetical protein
MNLNEEANATKATKKRASAFLMPANECNLACAAESS